MLQSNKKPEWLSELPEKCHVLAAVSGGADSIFLTLHLQEWLEKIGGRVSIAHINHHNRGELSDRDQEFVEAFAQEHGFECYIQHIDLDKVSSKGPQTDENLMRELRMSLLKAMADSIGASAVAFGHHQNDVAETFLINALRGSGCAGLEGMKKVRKLSSDMIFLRPLLEYTKSDLKALLNQRNIQWVEDETNSQNLHKRNHLRNDVIPRMEQFEVSAVKNIYTSSQMVGAVYDSYLATAKYFLREIEIHHSGKAILLDMERLTREPYIHLAHGLLRVAYEELLVLSGHESSNPRIPNRDTWRKIEERIHAGVGDPFTTNFIDQYHVILNNQYLLLYEEADVDSPWELVADFFSYALGKRYMEVLSANDPAMPHLMAGALREINETNPEKATLMLALIDTSACDGGLVWRCGVKEDTALLPSGEAKSFTDCLKEAHVPVELRAKVLVLADDQGILWIPGIRRAHRALINETSSSVRSWKFVK